MVFIECSAKRPHTIWLDNPGLYSKYVTQQMHTGSALNLALGALDPFRFGEPGGFSTSGIQNSATLFSSSTQQQITFPLHLFDVPFFSAANLYASSDQASGSFPARNLPPISTPPIASKPQFCAGSFVFAGKEADFGEGQVFCRCAGESNVEGLDTGSLYEGGAGGEGLAGGFAATQSFKTGQFSAFGYLGTGISGGPFAGIHFGVIYSPHEFGFYYEGHVDSVARGGGYAVTHCGR